MAVAVAHLYLFFAYNILFVWCSLLHEERFCYKPSMNGEDCSKNIFERFWSWRLRNAPELATSIGVHSYDNYLDEMSMASYFRRKNDASEFLEEIKAILLKPCGTTLSKTTELNLILLKDDLEQYINGLLFRPFLSPINILEGPQSDFPRLLSYMKTDTLNDFEKILSRLQQFPQQIDETITLLKEGIRLDLVMHNVSVSAVPVQIQKLLEPNLEDSLLYKPFKEKPKTVSDKEWEKILVNAKLAIADVETSYNKIVMFLKEEYIPKTRIEIGASTLPNGKAYYEACLKFHTTTNFTSQEIHNHGIAEVARITERMKEVKNKVNFTGTLNEFRTYMRTDPQFKFSSADEIVSYYQKIAEKINIVLPKYFSKLPKASFEIVPIPAQLAPSFPGAYYLAAPETGSRPGTFYINTYKPESRKKYEAISLTLHEAQPGHHTQAALTMESGSLVTFRRFMEDRKYYEPPAHFAMNTGYVEGWGLYSEYLGEEMGLYTNPYDLFGRLSHEILRACRLVVDTGIHELGWDRQKAIDYMIEHTASDVHDITSEIDRYITWPGQACGYKIGEMKIKELRSKAEKGLGDQFDLKEFHVLIASMGGVPLNILEDEVNEFISYHTLSK